MRAESTAVVCCEQMESFHYVYFPARHIVESFNLIHHAGIILLRHPPTDHGGISTFPVAALFHAHRPSTLQLHKTRNARIAFSVTERIRDPRNSQHFIWFYGKSSCLSQSSTPNCRFGDKSCKNHSTEKLFQESLLLKQKFAGYLASSVISEDCYLMDRQLFGPGCGGNVIKAFGINFSYVSFILK